MLLLHEHQLFRGNVAVDNVVGCMRIGTRRRRCIVADTPDLPGAAPGEETAPEATTEGWYGAGEPDIGYLGIRISYRRSGKKRLRVRM